MSSKRTEQFRSAYGPWALIIGGSLGIGKAFAAGCAARGLSLILTGRREGFLKTAVSDIKSRFGTECETLVCDMAGEDGAKRLNRETAGVNLGLVVYNAADTYVGDFLSESLDHHLRIIDTNCKSLLSVTHIFGSRFRDRGRGGIRVRRQPRPQPFDY